MHDRSSILCPMNRLTAARGSQIVSALVEGMSVRATCRMTDTAKGTVLRLVAELGEVCADYMDRILVNLPCKRVQCDEIWAFAYAKDKDVPEALADKRKAGLVGSIWTFTAICADTKLAPSWLVGERTSDDARGLPYPTWRAGWRNRIQLSTDGQPGST